MADIIDRAQILEEFDRTEALRQALSEPARRPDVCGRVIACVDCDDDIDVERLKARPAALRCITCQEAHERLRRLFPGT